MQYKCLESILYWNSKEKKDLEYFTKGKIYTKVNTDDSETVLKSNFGNFTIDGETDYSSRFEKYETMKLKCVYSFKHFHFKFKAGEVYEATKARNLAGEPCTKIGDFTVDGGNNYMINFEKV